MCSGGGIDGTPPATDAATAAPDKGGSGGGAPPVLIGGVALADELAALGCEAPMVPDKNMRFCCMWDNAGAEEAETEPIVGAATAGLVRMAVDMTVVVAKLRGGADEAKVEVGVDAAAAAAVVETQTEWEPRL